MTVTLTSVPAPGPCPACGHTPRVAEKIGYLGAIDRHGIDLSDFPVLARALAASEPAHNPKIEWTHHGHSAFNYCQILRTPFGATNAEAACISYARRDDAAAKRESLIAHLKLVEETLTFGTPTAEGYVRTCGGVWHFLGRLPRATDTVKLRILRDLVLKENVQAPDYDGVIHEWISEVSLLAHPE